MTSGCYTKTALHKERQKAYDAGYLHAQAKANEECGNRLRSEQIRNQRIVDTYKSRITGLNNRIADMDECPDK